MTMWQGEVYPKIKDTCSEAFQAKFNSVDRIIRLPTNFYRARRLMIYCQSSGIVALFEPAKLTAERSLILTCSSVVRYKFY